jgi:hypothetical protein
MTYFDQFGREFKKGVRVLVDRADPNGVVFPGTIHSEQPDANDIWEVDLDGWHHFVGVADCEMVVAAWKYHYCSYWRCWSRMLSEPGDGIELPRGAGPFVEVNLTPIPNTYSNRSTYEHEVNRIVIRSQRDQPQSRRQGRGLSPRGLVQIAMRGTCRSRLYSFIMEEDILPMIDWEKYNKVCNGGAALADCVVEPLPDDYT